MMIVQVVQNPKKKRKLEAKAAKPISGFVREKPEPEEETG